MRAERWTDDEKLGAVLTFHITRELALVALVKDPYTLENLKDGKGWFPPRPIEKDPAQQAEMADLYFSPEFQEKHLPIFDRFRRSIKEEDLQEVRLACLDLLKLIFEIEAETREEQD